MSLKRILNIGKDAQSYKYRISMKYHFLPVWQIYKNFDNILLVWLWRSRQSYLLLVEFN